MNSMDVFHSQNAHGRMRRFLQKPWREKARAVFFHWTRVFPGIPVPVRLPFGGWWLARNDFVGSQLFNEGFENTERSFVEHFLRPEMTVLDIGAHHGFYTLLASKKVGPKGRVIAIEASPRERERLNRHLRINGCGNVSVEGSALGEVQGIGELYLVSGAETGCNSLRQPNVAASTIRVSVSVEPLDLMLHNLKIDRVDFIKLDVEGAELSVLKGATDLLNRRPRPVILIEVQDIRTQPWGYPARDLVHFLGSLGFRWFRPLPEGKIQEIGSDRPEYDGNFVAVPTESMANVRDMVVDDDRRMAESGTQGVSLIT